jgi:hypothetical protein
MAAFHDLIGRSKAWDTDDHRHVTDEHWPLRVMKKSRLAWAGIFLFGCRAKTWSSLMHIIREAPTQPKANRICVL